MALLQQLRDGLLEGSVAQLPARQRRLLARLQAEHFVSTDPGTGRLVLSEWARSMLPTRPSTPDWREVSREHLDAVGLPHVQPFFIAQSPRPKGRPRIPFPRIYLKQIPGIAWQPAGQDLNELALALLRFDPNACRALIRAHPDQDWTRFKERVRAEVLVGRAAYFGIKKLVRMRERRTPPTPPTPPRTRPVKPRATRRDAYRRAHTEPVSGRRSRGQR